MVSELAQCRMFEFWRGQKNCCTSKHAWRKWDFGFVLGHWKKRLWLLESWYRQHNIFKPCIRQELSRQGPTIAPSDKKMNSRAHRYHLFFPIYKIPRAHMCNELSWAWVGMGGGAIGISGLNPNPTHLITWSTQRQREKKFVMGGVNKNSSLPVRIWVRSGTFTSKWVGFFSHQTCYPVCPCRQRFGG